MIKWVKRLSWLPAAAVMAVIFLFSAKTAVQSEQQSTSIAEKVLEWTGMDTTGRESALAAADHVIRKLAHASEYALLAICVGFHVLVRNKRGLKYFAMVIPFCALYAVSDEVHQLFVEGRSCQFTDMCIDTAGAAVGALLFYVLAAGKLNRLGASKRRLLNNDQKKSQ